jgi:Arc/MetJ-type ribon-helix-helix transcriptional regulator
MGTKKKSHYPRVNDDYNKTVTVTLLERSLKRIDALVIEGHFLTRSEFFHFAALSYLPTIENHRQVPQYPNLLELKDQMNERRRVVNSNHRQPNGRITNHPELGNAFFIPETEAESK